MKFNEAWLREWVNPPADTAALCDRLTMSGLELESCTEVAPAFNNVVVAAIVEMTQHPDADRLRICQADIGADRHLQIVTGASNVYVGMRVPLAQIGAVLPGDKRIGRSKLRGIDSEGMFCSTAELGISESSDGVLALPADAPLGTDIRDYLKLDDQIIELNVTPNRGDCLSLIGIAREVGAEFGVEICTPAIAPVPAAIDDRIAIELVSPADCPRYVGRVVRGIDPHAATPIWMSERLRRCGLRPIHPVVDITNYVMLELGQPMHAFDLRRIEGGIRVRRAAAGETLGLLDGQGVELTPETLVIADHRAALAMAGIMGGAGSSVVADTVDILFESAFFTPTSIAGRGRHYKLQTDSSQRFERGVDHAGQVRAIERATALLLSICGGQAGPVCEQRSESDLPHVPPILLRRARVERLLGYQLADEAVLGALQRLGMRIAPIAEGWEVTPPSSRPDLAIEADLIEEVVRIDGYERIPARPPAGRIRLAAVDEGGTPRLTRARLCLVQRGYQEAITYSFVDREADARVGSAAGAIALANPISADMAVMRTSLWTGLMRAAAYNLSRQQTQVRLFETGRSFENSSGKTLQINKLSGIVTGNSMSEQWAVRAAQVDFHDLKGDVEALVDVLVPGLQVEFQSSTVAALHPGQSAIAVAGGRAIATLGGLHPDLTKYFGIRQRVFVFEIDLDALPPAAVPVYAPLSKFPSVRRDLSLTLERSTPAGEVVASIREVAPAYLRDLQLFDVYEGEGIDSGKKSLALGLIFQGLSSTLRDKDIDAQVAAIVEHLAARLGAVLRDS